MESAAGFIVVVLILLILGAGGYFVYDYVKYKGTLEDQLATVQKNVQSNQTALVDEQKKRLGNMKYVVDQINTTNEDIYNTFTSNVTDTRSATTQLNEQQAKILSGIGSMMKFTTGVGAAASNVDFLSLPGAPTANMELLRRVSTVNGMNFNELRSDSTVKFCGQALNGAAARCIELPRADGKTVFRNIIDNKEIVMDGNVEFSSNVSFLSENGASLIGTSSTRPLSIRSNKFVQIGNQLNIGDSAPAIAETTPSSYMSIRTEPAVTKDALQISTPTASKVLKVDANGHLVFNDGRHSIFQNSDQALQINTNGLVVQTNTEVPGQTISLTGSAVSVSGETITLTGNVNVVGNLTVGGKAVTTAA